MNTSIPVKYDRTFQLLSYLVVLCGFVSLWISGTFGIAGVALFGSIAGASYFLEGSRWQMSERVGTVLTVLTLPAYYLLWRASFFAFSGVDAALPGILARLILTLSAIKLLQKKGDRDWIFLYVMAFFQILLAAGLSISALYLAVFMIFVLLMTATIILFEVRRTGSQVFDRKTNKYGPVLLGTNGTFSRRRLPIVSLTLLAFIVLIATPLFFFLPRVGGAGMGGSAGGGTTYSGFSETVRLGGTGSIQQNDEVVMRVRVEDRSKLNGPVRWRGAALDAFDNISWSKSRLAFRESRSRGDRDLIQIDYATGSDSLVIQTVYLEPLDTQVLFGLTRLVAVQANFPVLFVDPHGSVTFPRSGDRSTYKVLSDVRLPSESELRRDRSPVPESVENYLQLPDGLDPRIAERAQLVTKTATNRYDAAAMIEFHLRNDFGYTLEQKSGGEQPLADFLFNVREGHCEYFATAMAIMLRTQGIATRVVNGFQQGEYNETADVYMVRQREAHSWVEVYFPGQNDWVPFDPTPAAAQTYGTETAGFYNRVNKYLEALEMIWIQYFVAYDNLEQRSMYTSIKRSFSDYNDKTSSWLSSVQERIEKWWAEVRGDSGTMASIQALGIGIGVVVFIVAVAWLFVLLYRNALKWKVWSRLRETLFARRNRSIVEFYERMQRVLASNGFIREDHQTPLEFAYSVGMPEVLKITEKYNRVRFGENDLSDDESLDIQNWLKQVSDAAEHKKA